MPAVWKHQKQHKKAKLAQYARRVWHVTSGSIDEQADAAIDKTIAFFHSIGVPTRLDDYRIKGTDIRKVVDRFAERGTTLGENQNITSNEIDQILRLCL
jgi:NADP-dependent alcohol dehydrogenase